MRMKTLTITHGSTLCREPILVNCAYLFHPITLSPVYPCLGFLNGRMLKVLVNEV